jgi:hypothetical protein
MHILTSVPDKPFEADTFVQGSRQRLLKVVESIAHHFTFNAGRDFNPSSEWQAFAAERAPQSDSVKDFTAWKGLNCPLANLLLGLECSTLSSSASGEPAIKKPMARTIAGNSVAW